MHPIFDKKVLIVSGKGGVGKTTVAAALARAAAREGKRVCLVEIEEAESFRRLLGADLGFDPAPIAEGVDGVSVEPQEMLRRFLAEHIKVKALYSRLFRSPIYRYFVAAAPGLDGVMALGKVYLLAHETSGSGRWKRPAYDLVVVDAPASGHGLALLRVPQLIANSVNKGPVKYYADKLVAFLGDPAQVALLIVTLAEEMPVSEAIEMRRSVEESLPIGLAPVVVNAVYPPAFSREESTRLSLEEGLSARVRALLGDEATYEAAMRAMESRVLRREMSEPHVEKLRAAVAGDLVEIPFIFDREEGWRLVDAAADHLLAGLARLETAP